MTKRFSVGVIGAGTISRQSHLPVLTTMRHTRVAWITDTDQDRARSLAHAYRIPFAKLPLSPEDLPDCDVALLAIPVGVRAAYLNALAKRGTAVLVEKPFARTALEHREILQAFPPHRIACGFMRRTYASSSLFRRIVREGWFGPLIELRASEGNRIGATRTDRSYFDEPGATGGGVLAEGGCHALDLAFHITGATRYQIRESRMTFDGSVDRKAEGRVQLTTSADGSEQQVALEFGFSWLDRQPITLELRFGNVCLVTGGEPESPVLLKGLDEDDRGVPFLQSGTGARTSSQAFRLEWADFLRGIEEGRESTISAASCLPVTAMVEDLYLAAKSA